MDGYNVLLCSDMGQSASPGQSTPSSKTINTILVCEWVHLMLTMNRVGKVFMSQTNLS